jgi:hypothetical protein
MKKSALAVSLLSAMAALFAPAQAAFKDPLWSARVAGLGGAATAVDTGASSAFYNPAASVLSKNPEVHFTYAKLFSGLDDVDLSLNELGYVHPLSRGNVISAGWGSVVASSLRREDTLALGAAHLFEEVRYVGDLSAGATLRYLSQSYTLDERTVDDPTFQEGRTRGDVALDAHAYLPSVPHVPELALGLSLRSLNQPDVGFQEKDTLPFEVALGGLYRWKNFSVPLDLVFRDGDLTPQLGVEGAYLEDRLAVRAGTDTDQVGAGVGYKHELKNKRAILFDYTFLWPLNLDDSSGSHRATLGMRF